MQTMQLMCDIKKMRTVISLLMQDDYTDSEPEWDVWLTENSD